MAKVEIYKIFISGYDKPLWATEKQVQVIIGMENDANTRYNLITLGNQTFKPISVQRMEKMKVERYDIPVYATKRLETEARGQLGGLLN